MDKMHKKDLVKDIAARSGLAQTVVDTVLKHFQASVLANVAEGKEINLMGFGTFKMQERPERTARNPTTGEKISVPAKKILAFRRSKHALD